MARMSIRGKHAETLTDYTGKTRGCQKYVREINRNGTPQLEQTRHIIK